MAQRRMDDATDDDDSANVENVTRDALLLLQRASEAHVAAQLSAANVVALAAGRETLLPNDLVAIDQIIGRMQSEARA